MPTLLRSSQSSVANPVSSVQGMLNKLHGQPGSYDKKSQYRFGRTLGAGTYGIVREAEVNGQKVAVKIILKKNVKGNEQMVYDELKMLRSLSHPHIVKFHDWFESRVCNRCADKRSELTTPGQVLHCDSIGHRRRVVRSYLRPGQVHGKGRLTDNQTGPRSRRLLTRETDRSPRYVLRSRISSVADVWQI